MSMINPEFQARDLFEKIATPTRLAVTMAPEVMGRPYRVYPWVHYIEQEILAMLGRPGREVLIVSVPPQEGKTTLCGFWLPAWYLGMHPDNLLIFVSYSDEYSGSWGRRVRDFIDIYGGKLFNVGLNKSEQSVNNWRTRRGFGGMLSAGINGGITGNPGHFIVIDDVIKNMMEASSPATKKGHLEEWDGSISARFQEDTKVLITATRWAEDDVSGEVYARSIAEEYEGIPVRMIRIKAIAEPDEDEELKMSDEQLEAWRDCLGRKRGRALKGQHSAGFFREKQASVSPFVWSSLYQATPSARKGSMFPKDRWQYYDELPPLTVVRRVWDIAATEGGGDWTVGGYVGKDTAGNYYVVDIQRFQKSVDGVKNSIKGQAVTDGRHIPIRMEEERAGAGKTTIGFYRSELQGWQFEPVKAEGQKVSRFTPYSDLQQSGKVFLPRDAPWVDAFTAEHKAQMPDGRGPKFDDQIDVVAYAVIDMYDLGPIEASDPNAQVYLDGNERIEQLIDDHDVDMSPGMPLHLAAILGRPRSGDFEDEVFEFTGEPLW